MTRELHRLLKSYEFLKNSHKELRGAMSESGQSDLEQSLNRLFVDILMHSSDDPRVTLAQTRFLMGGLMDLTSDPDKGKVLRDACQRHLDRLQKHLSEQAPRSVARPQREPVMPDLERTSQGRVNVTSLQYRYFDSLTDRVAILDAEYRYIFTNAANARFHARPASEFVGLHNWQLVGKTFFETRNKARFDICLTGQSVSFVAPHPMGDPSTLYAVNMDPVFDQKQKVESVLVSCRDVSTLPIQPSLVSSAS